MGGVLFEPRDSYHCGLRLGSREIELDALSPTVRLVEIWERLKATRCLSGPADCAYLDKNRSRSEVPALRTPTTVSFNFTPNFMSHSKVRFPSSMLRRRGVEVPVEIACSGPAGVELRSMADARSRSNIYFRGFVKQQHMPGLLASADIFVLTSNWEPFGFIVNEAIAAGLLAVVSHDLSCSVDLVEEGINGCRVRSGCPTELADALQRLVEARARWPEMRAAAGAKLSRFSFADCAAGLREALAE